MIVDVLVDSTAYRRIIGGAMYLMTGSRPDIAYAISALSRYVSKPTETHFTAALHLVRYLIGTKHYALLLGTSKPDGKLSVSCYVDASYAADLDTRRSITGFLIAVNDSTVMWKSHRQPMVTLSSAEAEYVALSVAMKEVVAMTNFLQETGAAEIKLPMRVYEDNAAVIKMSTTTWSTPRSRHIAIRYHHIRELFASSRFAISHVKTGLQLADGLTKAVAKLILSKLITACFGH